MFEGVNFYTWKRERRRLDRDKETTEISQCTGNSTIHASVGSGTEHLNKILINSQRFPSTYALTR